jgi:Protein of unknown function (DUF3551)
MTNVSKLIFGAAITAIGVFAAVVGFEKSAAAQDHAWCAEYDLGSSGATNCGFATFQQCSAAVGGVGGSCVANPQYQEPRLYMATKHRRQSSARG